jgi:hypothetical protein
MSDGAMPETRLSFREAQEAGEVVMTKERDGSRLLDE